MEELRYSKPVAKTTSAPRINKARRHSIDEVLLREVIDTMLYVASRRSEDETQ
jgi:hypothetical protein